MHHDCAVSDCGRPTQDVICEAHRDDLVKALKSVSTHTPEVGVGRRLTVVAGVGLWDELDVTITRQHKVAPVMVGGRSGETPLVFNEAASDAKQGIARFVWYWAYMFSSANPHLTQLPTTVPEACDWMATFPGLLASLDGAEVMVEDILRETKAATRAIDLAVSRVYAGRCGAQLEIGVCEQHLYVSKGRKYVHCPSCGVEWPVEAKQDELLRLVEDKVVTAVEVSRLLNQIGVEIAASTVRTYAQKRTVRGEVLPPKLIAVGIGTRERPLYRVGDVLDLFLGRRELAA